MSQNYARLLQIANAKLYMVSQVVPLPMSLSDLWSLYLFIAHLIKCSFLCTNLQDIREKYCTVSSV